MSKTAEYYYNALWEWASEKVPKDAADDLIAAIEYDFWDATQATPYSNETDGIKVLESYDVSKDLYPYFTTDWLRKEDET